MQIFSLSRDHDVGVTGPWVWVCGDARRGVRDKVGYRDAPAFKKKVNTLSRIYDTQLKSWKDQFIQWYTKWNIQNFEMVLLYYYLVWNKYCEWIGVRAFSICFAYAVKNIDISST